MYQNYLKHLAIALLLAGYSLTAGGCASIVSGSRQEIEINSEPSGASIVVNGEPSGVTPAQLQFSRKTSHLVELHLEGYSAYEVTVEPAFNSAVYGNVLAGGIIGMAIDESSGASNTLKPESIFAKLAERN